MSLDPQVRTVLDGFAALGQPPLETLPVDEARQVARALIPLDGEPEPVAGVEERALVGVPTRVYRPDGGDGPLPVLAWFHAGGGVVGDLDTADTTARKLANRTGALVVSVGYRRAPEHLFPAAVDDCWAVTEWLSAHAGELAGDPERLAVGGDSAGGGFAAVVARRAARAGIGLRHQLLVYPFTDATLSNPTVDEYAEGYVLTKSLCEWFGTTYIGPGGDQKHPDASPLLADDVSGVAPATIVIAEYDPVRGDGEEYAARLREAGVPVEVLFYEGMIHVFFVFGAVVDRANQAMDDVAAALRRAFA